MKIGKLRMGIRPLALSVILLLAMSMAGCGSSVNSASEATSSYSVSAVDSVGWSDDIYEYDEGDGTGETLDSYTADLANTKIIYTGELDLQTTEFDLGVQAISDTVAEYGGYIESRSVSQTSVYRFADYVVRVPGEVFYDFMDAVGGNELFAMTYQASGMEDVSEAYSDIENRLETYNIKLGRLQELLSQAESVEDIITIQNSITDVEYQIESLTGQKNKYDSLINYSTVDIYLRETAVAGDGVNSTLGSRIRNGFVNGAHRFAVNCGDVLVWIVSHIIAIAIIVAVAVVAIIVIARLRRRKKH